MTERNRPRLHVVIDRGEPRGALSRRFDLDCSSELPPEGFDGWSLLMEPGATLHETLIDEMAEMAAAGDDPILIRVQRTYAGGLLDLAPEGIVMRKPRVDSKETLRRTTGSIVVSAWNSPDEHRSDLEERLVPHSTTRRLALFLRRLIHHRTLDPRTLQFLWIEAGFDHG